MIENDAKILIKSASKNPEESHGHIPFATWHSACGRGDWLESKLSFLAQYLHSPGSLIWSGPRHDWTVEERTRLMDVRDRLGSGGPSVVI